MTDSRSSSIVSPKPPISAELYLALPGQKQKALYPRKTPGYRPAQRRLEQSPAHTESG